MPDQFLDFRRTDDLQRVILAKPATQGKCMQYIRFHDTAVGLYTVGRGQLHTVRDGQRKL